MRSAKPWFRTRNTLKCCELLLMVMAKPGLSSQVSMSYACCTAQDTWSGTPGKAKNSKTRLTISTIYPMSIIYPVQCEDTDGRPLMVDSQWTFGAGRALNANHHYPTSHGRPWIVNTSEKIPLHISHISHKCSTVVWLFDY